MTCSQTGRLRLAALLFPAVLGAASLAGATDFSPGSISKAYPYKDLPGVTDQQKKKEAPDKAPDCTRELRMRGLGNLDRFDRLGEDAPLAVYRCEQNGLTIESEQAPRARTWNPLDLK